ncbi:hypothetical protein C8T65DRAFT_711030 [Cerioporus squamosus]|nr:hypothetical protein C8T65DRAFT_711030 [Cerioporus squamosus]
MTDVAADESEPTVPVPDLADPVPLDNTPPLNAKQTRRILPDDASQRLYSVWIQTIPTLVPDYLAYVQSAQGRLGGAGSMDANFSCPSGKCYYQSTMLTCLHFDSPLLPRIAVSVDLLDFYFALFERSADAITALAGALKSVYQRRGFPILNDKGEPILDPFRRGLGYAVQWYDCLKNKTESLLDRATRTNVPREIPMDVHYEIRMNTSDYEGAPRLTSDSCHRILQKRCPACFGGNKFGRAFSSEGGDIHVAIDATFSQRHNIAAGDSPWFHEPKYFVSKAKVDAVGDRITQVRKGPPRQRPSKVPESALDECEKSFEAADEKKAKTHGTKFDDTGLMALVCRHDIVIFLANVDTPGEQQKFGIALIEELVSLLPKDATVAVFYDIACVLDRSLQLYDILPSNVVDRLVFATSVMHAYGHQWACQLVYNPRLRKGLGLTEGEGTERIWSKFRKLIGVTRTSGRSRRIWYLDRHADSVNAIARQDLGQWIRSRLKNGVEARAANAEKELRTIEVSMPVLRTQWELQQAAQLSVRNHAPARLKKELDSVLNLQAELEEIQKYLETVKAHISKDQSNPEAFRFVESLQRSHERTVVKVESLYASLNVGEGFPELTGLPLDFVRTLLMARDLKMNIRKRAIGSFFEWDKLDRAAGGRDQALGTKLHQQTRKAIAKRTPALVTAIRKFNKYCDDLKKSYKKAWRLPLPDHLPTELGALRNDPSLLTDVWVTPVESSMPRWLEDVNDRCLEERRRLGDEADNLCRWYGRELAAVELALRRPRYSQISFLLEQQKAELLLLYTRWRTPLASETAQRLSGVASPERLRWTLYTFQDGLNDDEGNRPDPEEFTLDAETVLAQDTIAQFLDDPDDEQVLDADLPNDSAPVEEDVHREYATPSYSDQDDFNSSRHALEAYQYSLTTTLGASELPLADDDFDMIPYPDVVLRRRKLPSDVEHIRMTFWPDDLGRLQRAEGLINDDGMNGCAQLLLRYFGSGHVYRGPPALLSSYVMAKQLDGATADDTLWRCSQYTDYWRKNVWIMPVHRANSCHWELAVIYIAEQQIAYFDSFGNPQSWEIIIPDVLRLIFRLIRLAQEAGHEVPLAAMEGRWKAYPLVHRPMQTNGYDCGVWVLACIAAVLRGFHSVSLAEKDIAEFRGRLLALVLQNTVTA